MITELIDKQDNVELIRDQIAAILVTEVSNQKQLAINEGKDESLWDLRVFSERSNPWEQYLNTNDQLIPIVNVWFDSENFAEGSSNISERQQADAMFNIDCYGFGVNLDDDEGHKPSDREAALNAQRAMRLVRNILMASDNTYLQLRGLVWHRWPQSITTYQPAMDANPHIRVVGARLALRVRFNEFSPQYEFETLEYISTTVTDDKTGELLVSADYDKSQQESI